MRGKKVLNNCNTALIILPKICFGDVCGAHWAEFLLSSSEVSLYHSLKVVFLYFLG